MASVFNIFSNFIRRFEEENYYLVKQKKNKSSLCSQTYSWIIVIPLSRIIESACGLVEQCRTPVR